MGKRVLTVFLLLSIAIMGIYPRELFLAGTRAVDVWFNVFLPAVFPSMVLIRLLYIMGVTHRLSIIFGGFMWLFRLPKSGFEAFLGGFLSGFPSGGKIVGEMLRDGRIDRGSARKLFLVSNNPGIFFITSTVGGGVFKNSRYGYILLFSAVLSSVIVGMTISGDFFHGEEGVLDKGRRMDFLALKEAIMDSMDAITRVGGFIILFSVLSEGIGLAVSLNQITSAFLSGVMEMTGGINKIAMLDISMAIKLSSVSAIISFGGLSVIGQCISMLERPIVSLREFVAIRALNGVFSFCITYLICIFLQI